MGAGFARALLERGETVAVWNRSPEKAKALEADGARAYADPAEAVRGASRIHISLGDDASVDDVLEKAHPGIDRTAVIIDHSTTSPDGTLARFERWRERGIRFQHAPVFMGPQQAREHSGVMLASGPAEIFEPLRPELEKMTGKLLYLGDRVDKAAAFKLFGNLMLVFIVSGLADMYALGASLGIEPAEAQTLFDNFKPGMQLETRGKKMAQGDFTPLFELAMARKDIRLMLEEADRHGGRLDVLPAIAKRFDDVIAAGHGNDDLGALAYESVRTPASA